MAILMTSLERMSGGLRGPVPFRRPVRRWALGPLTKPYMMTPMAQTSTWAVEGHEASMPEGRVRTRGRSLPPKRPGRGRPGNGVHEALMDSIKCHQVSLPICAIGGLSETTWA